MLKLEQSKKDRGLHTAWEHMHSEEITKYEKLFKE